tara:strand:- start:429 stop:3335 length:2907 start_codon:yes stop_codon:yes gene_type:complete
MNQYTDLQVVECNRLHSEEAKSSNDENFAQWTNNLQDILHVDAGDKVSIHGAMINEKGAGQSQAIEIKGIGLGFKKTFEFLDVEYKNASNHLNTDFEEICANASSKEIEIRDDTLTFGQTYYQTATGHNYIHLPRRWWYKRADNTDQQWTLGDSEDAGLSRYFVNFEIDKFGFKSMYQAIDLIPPGEAGQEDQRVMKPKNDNKRYTLMMREYSFFSEKSASDNYLKIPIYNEGRRDPENASYSVYKELKQIELPKGFNSPEFVADEITRQFQKITEEKIHKKYYTDPSLQEGRHETPIPMYRTISTESYKPFNVAHLFRDPDTNINASGFGVIQDSFEEYYIRPTETKDGWEYLSQYHLIGCDKPELRLTGEKINQEYNAFGSNRDQGILGCSLKHNWAHDQQFITLNVAYNKDFCDKVKAFFDAQVKYPEVWDYFKEEDNEYNDGDTIHNSRYLHINRWQNASLTKTASANQCQLGDSYYTTPDWFEDVRGEYVLNSALLPIFFDEKQKDTFYEFHRDMFSHGELSYGCITASSDGYAVIIPTQHNGTASPLYTELKSFIIGETEPFHIEAGRKIGFDMHFNAPGMSYILPYSGYAQKQSSFKNASSSGDYEVPSIDHWSDQSVQGFMYNNKLYFGATSPKLQWTGTNFQFSDLHTPLNRSQDIRNKDPEFSAFEDNTATAGDVVYKINPLEMLRDWTPDRKPYRLDEVASQGNAKVKFYPLNQNLVPWQIYDSTTGIFLQDFNLSESEWKNTLWDILGFSYKQFNSTINNRLIKTDNNNINNLQLITTNAEIGSADSKVYVQNGYGAPIYNNMMPMTMTFDELQYPGSTLPIPYYAPITQKTESNKIIADNLPTRMIRGYYTIRSDILSQAQFIGGKVNNTTMPIIGIVDKINGDGDFYFGQESSLQFTALKPIRLSSIRCSVHDPDGSYANCGEQSTILFKIQKNRNVSFNVIGEILQEEQQSKK